MAVGMIYWSYDDTTYTLNISGNPLPTTSATLNLIQCHDVSSTITSPNNPQASNSLFSLKAAYSGFNSKPI